MIPRRCDGTHGVNNEPLISVKRFFLNFYWNVYYIYWNKQRTTLRPRPGLATFARRHHQYNAEFFGRVACISTRFSRSQNIIVLSQSFMLPSVIPYQSITSHSCPPSSFDSWLIVHMSHVVFYSHLNTHLFFCTTFSLSHGLIPWNSEIQCLEIFGVWSAGDCRILIKTVRIGYIIMTPTALWCSK